MNRSIASAARSISQRLARDSRCIDELARAVDSLQNEWIANCAAFEQIDRASQKLLQGVSETEELFERRQRTVVEELHEKVDVARIQIEIRGARSRAEDLEARDVEAPAQRDHVFLLGGYLGMHGRDHASSRTISPAMRLPTSRTAASSHRAHRRLHSQRLQNAEKKVESFGAPSGVSAL